MAARSEEAARQEWIGCEAPAEKTKARFLEEENGGHDGEGKLEADGE